MACLILWQLHVLLKILTFRMQDSPTLLSQFLEVFLWSDYSLRELSKSPAYRYSRLPICCIAATRWLRACSSDVPIADAWYDPNNWDDTILKSLICGLSEKSSFLVDSRLQKGIRISLLRSTKSCEHFCAWSISCLATLFFYSLPQKRRHHIDGIVICGPKHTRDKNFGD